MKYLLLILSFFAFSPSFSQMQACPVNINYSLTNLSHWFGYTGTFQTNTSRVHFNNKAYDSVSALPTGTLNATILPEFGSNTPGIQVLTSPGTDPFGGYPTIPTINGYAYNYSMKIGSTSTASTPGGFFRGLGYTINVPAGSVTEPYTMTYAYAMVLESAPHISDQVPMFSANLNTSTGTIQCADASYLLPTNYDAATKTYILDQNAALSQGFSLSGVPSPNGNNGGTGTAYRVWTKGWTEVTFDLAAYRGQQVTLIFEADNCVPKGHFAYAYVALRNSCNGLQISGNPIACSNGTQTYSIPALAGATYQWTIPPSWKMVKDSLNIINVTPGNLGGFITARETNSCADLVDTISVSTSAPTIPGKLSGDTSLCISSNATNSFPLTLTGNTGSILKWISSTNGGISWTNINDTTASYVANNVSGTTIFKAIVQNGSSCSIDSSTTATIMTNLQTIGGNLSPNNIQICKGQNMSASLALIGYNGSILNWQSSQDSVNWNDFVPVKTDSIYNITGVSVPTQYRAIVRNGTCAADTSNEAFVGLYNAQFPQASVYPADTAICLGSKAFLNAYITIGTNYTWSNAGLIFNAGNGSISSVPFIINAQSAPSKNTDYILTITNAGCPNKYTDTIHVKVLPAFTVNAGRDTFVVANQPLQLMATVSIVGANMNYLWTPPTGLNNQSIANPISILGVGIDSMRYYVTATDSLGCTATDNVLVRVFNSGPEIYVPSAFTPNGDGKNDIIRPITVGILQLNFFSIYNRWGQMLYRTSEIGKGWDGIANGNQQPSGTYVYTAEGTDYLGHVLFRKGTVVLIR